MKARNGTETALGAMLAGGVVYLHPLDAGRAVLRFPPWLAGLQAVPRGANLHILPSAHRRGAGAETGPRHPPTERTE